MVPGSIFGEGDQKTTLSLATCKILRLLSLTYSKSINQLDLITVIIIVFLAIIIIIVKIIYYYYIIIITIIVIHSLSPF